MIKCANCGRENDDSFTFCLDCGQRLRPEKEAAPPAPPKKPTATESPRSAALPKPEPVPAQPAKQPVNCPSCGTKIEPGNAFCSSCGFRLGAAGERRTMFLHTAGATIHRPSVRLVLILPDGSEGTVYPLKEGTTTIGRTQGEIQFPNDPYLSPSHAKVMVKDQTVFIEDLGSLNGVYYRIKQEMLVEPGASFRIGQQLLRLELPGDFQPLGLSPPPGDDSRFWGSPPPQVWARLVQVLEGGKIGEIHLLIQPKVTLGREIGEIRFPDDGFISARHCLLANQDGTCTLKDLDSSNGTFLRLHAAMKLGPGDRLQVGSQVFKLEIS